MKIRGTTITTPISRAAIPEDGIISEKPWSSKNTVDKLCPTFTESGTIVTCEPVEGYPLEVTAEDGATITRCGKNLINPAEYAKKSKNTTASEDTFTTNFNDNGLFVNTTGIATAIKHPPGTYTATLIPVTEGLKVGFHIYSVSSGAKIASNYDITATKPSFTFTANDEFVFRVSGDNKALGTYSYKLQLEVGSVATAYEPYKSETFAIGENVPALPGINTLWADKGIITVKGKANPSAIIEKLTNAIIALGGNI